MLATGDAAQWLIGLTKATLWRLLQLEEHRADAIALYVFYAYTARWQGGRDIRATNTYAARGLNWGTRKVSVVRQVLEELGLVKAIPVRSGGGQVEEWHVRVFYLTGHWAPDEQAIESDPEEDRHNAFSQHVAETQAIIREKGIANKKEKITKSWQPSTDFLDEALQAEWAAFQLHRKQMGKPMTPLARRRMIEQLNTQFAGIPERIQALGQSIANGWQGVFPLRSQQGAQKPTLRVGKRNEIINKLNRRKAELMRKPQTKEVQRELAAIQTQLYKL